MKWPMSDGGCTYHVVMHIDAGQVLLAPRVPPCTAASCDHASCADSCTAASYDDASCADSCDAASCDAAVR